MDKETYQVDLLKLSWVILFLLVLLCDLFQSDEIEFFELLQELEMSLIRPQLAQVSLGISDKIRIIQRKVMCKDEMCGGLRAQGS